MIYSTKTLKMAVIGDPIEHSLSPFLHGKVIEEHGYDALYIPVRVAPDDTRRFAEAAAALGFAGFNATMPHKVKLLDVVDNIDEKAVKYGAINTVRIRDGVLTGYNTDADGLIAALARRDTEISGADVMIIGAGGAAGALVHGFAEKNAAQIKVLNRTVEKAEKVTRGVRGASALALSPDNLAETAAGADIIVNCTPLGMSGMKGDFEDLSFLDDTKALVCDLIYNPWQTSFLKYAGNRGLGTMNGMDMLIYQGLLAFQIFTDIDLDLDAEYDYLYPLCRERLEKNAGGQPPRF